MTGDNFLSKVLLVFTESLIVAAVGAYFSKFVPSALFIVIFIAELILIFVVNKVRNNPVLAPLFLFIFAFLSGLTVGPLVYTFINAGLASIVIQAFVITSLIFVLLTASVYIFRINIVGSKKITGFLFVALIGIIIASVVNIFLHNPLFQFYISIAVVLIFSGYIIYDISNIVNNPKMTNEYVAALNLYLDFVNIFIALLEILGFLENKG